VKALMRGFGLLLLSAIVLGFSGCSTDNENEAAKAASNAGTPPPSPDGGTASSTPPVHSMDDYAKSKQGYRPYADTKLDPAKKK
jgi:hypothetical protein